MSLGLTFKENLHGFLAESAEIYVMVLFKAFPSLIKLKLLKERQTMFSSNFSKNLIFLLMPALDQKIVGKLLPGSLRIQKKWLLLRSHDGHKVLQISSWLIYERVMSLMLI